MINGITQLRKIPGIIAVSRVDFSGDIEMMLKDRLTPGLFESARKNSKKIHAYKIVYKSNGHAVAGFIIEPRNGKKLPCIIYNRGGSKDFGSIRIGRLFLDLADMADWGYVVIASQYSGNGGSEGRDEMGGKDVDDVLNLRKILKAYPYADDSRIGMYGHSRGGMMTYLSLAKVKWIKAAAIGAGLADEVGAPKFRHGWDMHQKEMYGGSLIEKKKRSALYWTDAFSKKTPILLMHGSADWRVNPLDSLRMAEKLYLKKVPFRLVFFEGADHGLSEFECETKIQIKDWFEKYLKKDTKIDLCPHGK